MCKHNVANTVMCKHSDMQTQYRVRRQENRPLERFEATAGFEPAIRVLQTPALPLGYVAALPQGIHLANMLAGPPPIVKCARQMYPVRPNAGTETIWIHFCEIAMNDQMILCERCGVTFLWTIEDQREAMGRLKTRPLCMGCALLLPAAERERGLVKWYSARRKYGFITPRSGPELFAHRSRLIDVGRLRQGDLVEFSIAQSERGPEAVDVRLLSRPRRSEAGQDTSGRAGNRAAAAAVQPPASTSVSKKPS